MKIGITDYAEKYIEEHTTRKKYYSEESYNKIKQKLESYENMRKEIIRLIENNTYEYKNDKGLKDKALSINVTRFTNLLLNILNKVGEDNETV